MLRDIIALAIADEPDIEIVENAVGPTEDVAAYTRRKRVDVLIFSDVSSPFDDAHIDDLLHANPRLGLIEVNGPQDRGMLHRLVAAHEDIGALAQSSLTAAIRAGAAMRRR